MPRVFILLFVILAPVAWSQPADSLAERLDALLAPYAGPETPGVLVGVVRGGALAEAYAVGAASLAHAVPMTVETRSNIGSTAKQFTGFALALLAEQGRLSLDDDVRAHLPELPDFGETVTLRHLLTHTSGYREFLNALAIGGWRLDEGDHIDRQEIFRVVQRQPALQNAPGAEWNYNNTGYALLAEVVARVTGEPFPTWMATHVFEPLGMSDTVVRAHPWQVVPNRAQGYVPDGRGGFREGPDLGGAMGAGGVYSTLNDLARWMGNLASAEHGGRALIDRMTTPFVLTTGDTTAYGLGLILDVERGQRRIQHGGGDLAHRTAFEFYPDLDAGLIVMTGNAAMSPTIVADIREIVFGEHLAPLAEDGAEPADFDPAGFDPAAFDVFAGRYELEAVPGFILTFWREGDVLYTQATGQQPIRIVPTSDSTFAITVVDARIAFHRDATGAATGLTLFQNGVHPARRLADEDAEPLDLSPYEGRFYSRELDTSYTVEADSETLVFHHRRLDPITLAHAGNDQFAGPFPLMQITFERDENGRVAAFRASNGRARDITFERVTR